MNLESHCNVGSKRKCCPLASNVELQATNKTLFLRAVGSYNGKIRDPPEPTMTMAVHYNILITFFKIHDENGLKRQRSDKYYEFFEEKLWAIIVRLDWNR